MINEEVVQDAPPASSPGPDTAADPTAQVAPEVTTASTGDPADTTPPAEDALAEFKADVAKAAGTEPADEGTKEPAAETAKTDEPAADKAETKDPEALSQEVNKVPETLTERPEWQALTKIGDKLGKAEGKEVRAVLRGIYKREHELTTQVEKAKPALEVVNEMFQSVGGSEQGFTNMRTLIKSFASDPAGAVPMLETLLKDARQRAGLEISSPELLTEAQAIEQQLNDGMIDQGAADKRKQELLELQQARKVKETTQAREAGKLERQQREQAEQQQRAVVAEINQAEADWTTAKLKADPDFGAVQNLHGAFAKQAALDFFNTNHRYPTPAEAKILLDESLKQAKAEALKFKPKPRERIAVNGGNGSSGNHRQAPMTEYEQFQADLDAAQNRHRR